MISHDIYVKLVLNVVYTEQVFFFPFHHTLISMLLSMVCLKLLENEAQSQNSASRFLEYQNKGAAEDEALPPASPPRMSVNSQIRIRLV